MLTAKSKKVSMVEAEVVQILNLVLAVIVVQNRILRSQEALQVVEVKVRAHPRKVTILKMIKRIRKTRRRKRLKKLG